MNLLIWITLSTAIAERSNITQSADYVRLFSETSQLHGKQLKWLYESSVDGMIGWFVYDGKLFFRPGVTEGGMLMGVRTVVCDYSGTVRNLTNLEIKQISRLPTGLEFWTPCAKAGLVVRTGEDSGRLLVGPKRSLGSRRSRGTP